MDVLLSRDTDRDKKIKNIQKVSLEDVSAAAKKLKKISSVIVKGSENSMKYNMNILNKTLDNSLHVIFID